MKNIRSSSFLFIRRQHGLTLVEILVALVISLFLMAGVIQLFIGSKQTYRFHDALSRIQENGRFALDVMAADIRIASYSQSGVLPPPNAVATTDTGGIQVRWLENHDPNLPSPPPETRRYDIWPRTGAAPNCPAAGTSLSLVRNGDRQELIEGVEDMQILYGVCTNGVVNPPYVNAAGVADWDNVCSMRIHLLLVSLENNIISEPQTVFFPMDSVNTIVPGDRCLRQAFSTTVAIRNRIP